tara:strand:- start:297 stop:509 length:213 start_codon:yes stop_codon:yes gene_type:complete
MSNEMGMLWARQQQARADRMEELYKLDGRDGDHPKHGLYTGLHQEVLTYERLKKELEIYEKWHGRFSPKY